jgi:hypothetical protein
MIMNIHPSVKPGLWGAVGGAAAMAIVGFWGLGWTTAGSADRAGQTRATAAVLDALVPFCVVRAQQDPDQVKLSKFRAETSSWSRTQIVRDAGWATMDGMTSPDSALATACAETLSTIKTAKTG